MPELVIKKDGKKEPYQKEKVIQSLKRIKIDEETINSILAKIDQKLPSVITTKKLYQFIFDILKEKKNNFYLKYNLRQAISLLGPSGYPFEKFFAEILNLYGYETKINVFLSGKCLTYEVDVVAQKENLSYFIECKFHQKNWQKNDLKTILYVYGRHLDLKINFPQSKAWAVTNTKFTTEAIKLAECYDLKLTSWDYPPRESLVNLIEDKKFYPVTILTSSSSKTFQNLVKFNIISIQDLLKKDIKFLKKITNLSESEIQKILEEAKLLL